MYTDMILNIPTPSSTTFPEGECIFTGITYGSKAIALGRNWDCVKRGTYDYSALCPCGDCWWDYIYRYTRLQSVCRMLLVQNRLRNNTK